MVWILCYKCALEIRMCGYSITIEKPKSFVLTQKQTKADENVDRVFPS